MKSRIIGKWAGLVVLVALGSGCAGVPYKMASLEPDLSKYEVLGEGTGAARGYMVLNLIPVGQNDKIEREARSHPERGGDE